MDLSLESPRWPIAAVGESVALPGIYSTGVLREHADDVVVEVDGRTLAEAADQVLGLCTDSGYLLLSAADADVTFQVIGPIYLERSVPARGVWTVSMQQVVLDRLAVTRLARWSARQETVRLRGSPHGCTASVVDVAASQDVPGGGALFDRQALLIKASNAAGSLRFRIRDGRCYISGGDGQVLVAATPAAAAAEFTIPAQVIAEAMQSGFGPDLLITITPGPTLVIRFGAAGGLTIALGPTPGRAIATYRPT